VNLRKREYCFFNEQLSADDYKRKLSNIDLSKFAECEKWKKKFQEFVLSQPKRACRNFQHENVIGDNLERCKNMHHCFDLENAQDCCYVYFGIGDEGAVMNCCDCYIATSEVNYETTNVAYVKGAACSVNCERGSNVYYSAFCYYCEHVFGCVGLKHRQYCIFNKQYSKDEYFNTVDKLISHMRNTNEYGEAFPIAISPFAYNESLAHEYFPMTKDDVAAKGWEWRDEKDEIPKVEKIIPAGKLPDSINDIPDDILNWAIECTETKRPYLIIRQELDFYRRMGLPVPRVHPDERHKRRMALKNPRKIWTHKCSKCGKEVYSSYSPDRPEIVYCEECYLREVY